MTDLEEGSGHEVNAFASEAVQNAESKDLHEDSHNTNWTNSNVYQKLGGTQADDPEPETSQWPRSKASYYSKAYHNAMYDASAEDVSEMCNEDFEGVPSFDELPSVLFLTGDVDKKTLLKSVHLYQQKQMLKKIQEDNKGKLSESGKSGVQFDRTGVRKNKNKNLRVTVRKTEVNINPDLTLNQEFEKSKPDLVKVKTEPENYKGEVDHNEMKENKSGSSKDLIRQKRLKKLQQNNSNYQNFRKGEQSSFRRDIFEDDNRKIIMREEKMRKKKMEKKMVTRTEDLTSSEDTTEKIEQIKPQMTRGKDDYKKEATEEKEEMQANMRIELTKHDERREMEADKSVTSSTGETSKSAGEILAKLPDVETHSVPESKSCSSSEDEDVPYAMRISMRQQQPQTTKTNSLLKSSKTTEPNKSDDCYEEEDFDNLNKTHFYQAQFSLPKGAVLALPLGDSKQLVFTSRSQTSEKRNKNALGPGKSYKYGGGEVTKSQVKNKNQSVNLSSDAQNKNNPEANKVAKAKSRPEGTSKVLKLQVSNVEERRAKAFKSIKQRQYQSGIHCSSCGRADCNSVHVQKMREMVRAAKQTGFEVRDVTPDGNCMFGAVVDQLEFYADYTYRAKSLREAAVNWLIENPNSRDGTPIESFLDEDWQTYLQRMLGEGQWGDHIVLDAIVQVIGHTVKVMNVDKGECHWTFLEPYMVSSEKDKHPVILGQLGEFHFVSLRPSDAQTKEGYTSSKAVKDEDQLTGIPEDLNEIQLEGTETVAMFQDGYIDPESNVPLLHLSYLIGKVCPRTVIDQAAIYTSRWEEDSGKPQFENQEIVIIGEIGNREYIPSKFGKLEVKCLALQSNPQIVSRTERSGKYILDESGVHPGFAKVLITEGEYTMHMFSHDQVYNSKDEETNNKDSQYFLEDGKLYTKYARRMILSFRVVSWPGSAQSWKTRLRFEDWPPQHLIDKVVSTGCVIKPFSHKNSPYATTEWELGFDLAEKILFKEAVTPGQQHCYILWKSLIMLTADSSGPLSLDHLRSVFLYCCERVPAEFWSSNPGACVLYMVDNLLHCLGARRFPNYFVPTNNMVDHFTERELSDAAEKIRCLRIQPLEFLFQFNEVYRYLTKGEKVFQNVQNDMSNFHQHRSIKQSTLESLVPTSVKIAQDYLKVGFFEEGFNMLSQTYEDRLSVTSCNDGLPFHLFLQDALHGLDQKSIVWFSAYAELHLKGQLPNPIVVDLCGDKELMKICDIIPTEIAGEFKDTLVPRTFSNNIYTFCCEFAMFLREIGKADTERSVLYYAHDTYKKFIEAVPEQEDNSWEFPVIQIYSAFYFFFYGQGQKDKLKEFFPEMELLVKRLKSPSMYRWLASIYSAIHEHERAAAIEAAMTTLSPHSDDQWGQYYLQNFIQQTLKIVKQY